MHQCGVLSQHLFNVYFDEMIYKLEKRGIGGKIGTHFIGALAYADVILLYPSMYGLQNMIIICEQFGIDFRVTGPYLVSFDLLKHIHCVFLSLKVTLKSMPNCSHIIIIFCNPYMLG